MFLWFQGVICCRIKAQEIFLFSFPGRVPVIFHWISEGLWNSSFIEGIFKIKNWKNCCIWVFLQFYEAPDLGKNIFTAWNVLKSEVYLTCINFWKFHNLKRCLDVNRLPSWPEKVKVSVKMKFFMVLTPWKLSLWINGKLKI